MPKVVQRKARKDYPSAGIVKGETYYYTKLKLQRGGIEKRSKTPFKPSQLTTSPFKGGWYAAQEAFEAVTLHEDGSSIREAAEAIRALGEEAQGSFDNMPVGLQQGDTGQTLEARASGCEDIADQLEGLADDFDNLEEPESPEGVPDLDGDNQDAIADAQDEEDQYATDLAEWEEEKERLVSEAADLLSNMPE